MMTIEGQALPASTREERFDRIQASSEIERLSKLTDHLQSLASEYDTEMNILKEAHNR